jgi:hypothetical protein
MFQIQVLEKVKTHILCSVHCFTENRAVYEKMSKIMVEPERPQMAIWRRFACWISKTTRAQAYASVCAPTPTHARTREHTHKYVRLVACLRQQWFRERASVSRYMCIASLVSN